MHPIFVFEWRRCSNEEMVEYTYGASDPNLYTFLFWVRRDISFHRV